MRKLQQFDIEDFWLAGAVTLFIGLMLTVALWIKGVGFLPSAIIGLLVGLFSGLAVLSEEFKFLRIICALIGIILSILLCNYAQFSIPVTVLVIVFGAALGYFSRKWIDILSYIS